MNIGQNIQNLRKSRRMTQSELAEKLGVSEQAVSKWENDVSSPDVSMLPMIARLFRVSIDRLYGFHLESYDAEVDALIAEADEISGPRDASVFLREALARYPNSSKLKYELAFAHRNIYVISGDENERADSFNTAIRLLNDIADNEFDVTLLDRAYTLLATLYSVNGQYDKAEYAAAKISSDDPYARIIATVNILAAKNDADAMRKFAQHTLFKCYAVMLTVIEFYTATLYAQEIATDEELRLRLLNRRLLALFDDGCDDFYATQKMTNAMQLASVYKHRGETDSLTAAVAEFKSLAERVIAAREQDHRIARNVFFAALDDPDMLEPYMTVESASKFMEDVLKKLE